MPKCSVRPYGLPGNFLDCRSSGRKLGSPVHGGVVGAGQVGRAAPQLRQRGGQGAQHLAGGGAGGHPLGVGLEDGQRVAPAVRQLAVGQPVVQGLALGVGRGPGVVGRLPLGARRLAALDQTAGVGEDLVGDLEGLLRIETEQLLGGGDLLVTQRGAVRAAGALGLGGRPGDDRLQLDEAGSVGDLLGGGDRGVQGGDVLDVVGVAVGPVDGLHVPAVRLVARGDVLAEGDVGVVLDGDPVAVVDQRQVAQPLGAGQRGRLAGHAFLDVAVGAEGVDVVVERRLTRCGVGVEEAPLAAGGHGHPDRVRDALAERAGGDLDGVGVAVLRVARGLTTPRCAATSGHRARARIRRGRAGCTGSGWSARRTARNGRGRPSAARTDRVASPSGRAGTPPGPG